MDIIVTDYNGVDSLTIKPEDHVSTTSFYNTSTEEYEFQTLIKYNDIYYNYLRIAHKYRDNEVPECPVVITFVDKHIIDEETYILIEGSQAKMLLV